MSDITHFTLPLQQELSSLPLDDPRRHKVGCIFCKHHEVWDEVKHSPYHSMCVSPNVLSFLDDIDGHVNSGVRCNEAREFKHVCGTRARFFEIKVQG